jgi:putative transposase
MVDGNQSTMYEQRVRFTLEVQQRTFSFAESCRRCGIGKTVGYTWRKRFLAEGFEELHDRSHRPHHCPHAVADAFVEHVVDLRQRYGWGSRKIRKLTAEKFGSAPARRTIDPIFERHDLIAKKRRRSGKPGYPGKPLTPMDEPSAVWTADFKGQFKVRNGRYCYPPAIPDPQPILARVQGVVSYADRARQACIHQGFP